MVITAQLSGLKTTVTVTRTDTHYGHAVPLAVIRSNSDSDSLGTVTANSLSAQWRAGP